MAQYRCYNIDLNGHIIGVEVFNATSDSAACACAHDISVKNRWSSHQVWELGRKLDCQLVSP